MTEWWKESLTLKMEFMSSQGNDFYGMYLKVMKFICICYLKRAVRTMYC